MNCHRKNVPLIPDYGPDANLVLFGSFWFERDHTGVMVRMLLVGAGLIATSVHLPAIARCPNAELVGLVDLSELRAKRIAETHGVPAFTSMKEAIGQVHPDAVVLCVPGEQALLAREALSAGLHVLAEKPLAFSASQAEELARLAAEVERVLWVGYMKMADPAIAFAKEAMNSIGRLQMVEIEVIHPDDERQVGHIHLPPANDAPVDQVTALLEANEYAISQAVGPDNENFRRLYADVILGSVVHQFSVLRALGFQAPADFTFAEAWPWPTQGTPPNLVAYSDIGAPGNAVTSFLLKWIWAHDAPSYRETVRIFGTGGDVLIHLAIPYLLDATSSVTVSRFVNSRVETITQQMQPEGSYMHQLRDFISAVESNGFILSDALGAARDAMTAQALTRSVALRHAVTLGGEAAS